MRETRKSLGDCGTLFKPLPQLLKNVKHSGGAPLEKAQVKKAIADGEKTLGKKGRLFIRPSGTEPLIRVMAEGEDSKMIAQVVDQVVKAING
jgi:phosphoglucosamine mutase